MTRGGIDMTESIDIKQRGALRRGPCTHTEAPLRACPRPQCIVYE